MKTRVEIKHNILQTVLKSGDIGYIDGYVRGGNNAPYAVVVVGDKIDMAPLYSLKIIKHE